MRDIPAALQALIDADAFHPIVAVTITLRDGVTVLRVANRDVTVSGNVFVGDLVDLPRVSVSSGSGIDNTVITISNADDSYSLAELDDDYDGAICTVESYFADQSSYTTFQGPVLTFSGVVSEPVLDDDRIVLTIMSDSRLTGSVGRIGRTIKPSCMNTFRGANCGYSYSATISSTGTYLSGVDVPIDEVGLAVQQGVAMSPKFGFDIGVAQQGVDLTTSGVPHSSTYVIGNDLSAGTVQFSSSVTVTAGDKIEYSSCPRDSMESCARRWQVGSATRQQDSFMGFDYHRAEQRLDAEENQGVMVRYQDLVDKIIPIAYGERWVTPLAVQSHSSSSADTVGWASWATALNGPFIVVIIGEGPVDTGVVQPLEDIYLDGRSLLLTAGSYADGDPAKVWVSVGNTSPSVSDIAPSWTKDIAIPGMSGMPNVAYAIIDLPDTYDLSPTVRQVSRPTTLSETTNWNSVFFRGGGYMTREYWEAKTPDIRLKYKGKKVQTWNYVITTPTKSSVVYSRNPVWQILDLISAPQRVAPDDLYSSQIAEANIDHASFIDWAGYADETVSQFDNRGAAESVSRYQSDLYLTDDDGASALASLLQVCRGALVEKNGKIGIVCDAPLGGSGFASSWTATSLTDSSRNGTNLPTWPIGLIAGSLIEVISGPGLGDPPQVIVSNTADTITVASWPTTPTVLTEYSIYSKKLTVDNVGKVQLKRGNPTHSTTNEIVVTFDSTSFQGREGTISVQDRKTDGFSETHIDRFGRNSKTVQYPAITGYGLATRTAWYALRRGLDQNRLLMVSDANVSLLALEVGDIVSVSHAVGDISNNLFRLERKVSKGGTSFDFVLRVHSEISYLDWPTDNFDGLEIRSLLRRSAYQTPPHVEDLAVTSSEASGHEPTFNCTYTIPPWEFDGGVVVIEGSTDAGVTYSELHRSDQEDVTFSVRAGTSYVLRAIFVSQARVRADTPAVIGSAPVDGTPTTLIDAARASDFEVDGFQDYTVILRKGIVAPASPVEESRVILSNTVDTLTVTSAWTDDPNTGDSYEVYIPADTVSISTASTAQSSVVNWINVPAQVTPSEPTSLNPQGGTTQNTVDLTWNDIATDELEYEIWRAVGNASSATGEWTEVVAISPTAAGATSASDTDTTTLATSSYWWYRIRARSLWAYSDYAPDANGTLADLTFA